MYVLIMIFVVVMFIVAQRMYLREGLIAELKQPPVGIPNVPSDTVCMVFNLAGVDIDKYGSLKNHCAHRKQDLKQDNSNFCAA
jgi:hypothetical protein